MTKRDMFRSLISRGILITIIFCFCSNNGFSYFGQKQDDLPPYFLDSNKILYGGRHINLLINEENITEENLKKLMKYFFEKYPDPERLYGYIASRTFDLADNLDGVGNKPSEKFARGIIIRHQGNELIRYNSEGEKIKTILIKGSDPFR